MGARIASSVVAEFSDPNNMGGRAGTLWAAAGMVCLVSELPQIADTPSSSAGNPIAAATHPGTALGHQCP